MYLLSFPPFDARVLIEGVEAADAAGLARSLTAQFDIPNTIPKGVPRAIAVGELPHGEFCIEKGGNWAKFLPASPVTQVYNPSRFNPEIWAMAISRILAAQGVCVVHAAGVVVDDEGTVFLGQSGDGKSTIAAAALSAGWRVVSDDSLAFGFDSRGRLVARPYRSDISLRPPSDTVLPSSAREKLEAMPSVTGHSWILRRDRAAACFSDNLSANRLVRLRRKPDAARTVVGTASAAAILMELIKASSPWFLSSRFPVEKAMLMPVLVRLASMAAFEVHTGSDLLSDPASVLLNVRQMTGQAD